MDQQTALQILQSGRNVFLTGAPGAGKTYVLNQYLDWLHDRQVSAAVTASTGIAATHIGGMTIHSWSGIGVRDQLSDWDLEAMLERQPLYKRVTAADVLVIDEISMLSANFLDMVDRVCRAVRQQDQPFGGLQIVLVGDFFQLPPIGRAQTTKYAFSAEAWSAADIAVCYLDTQYRQADDVFIDILTSLRQGTVTEAIWQHFRITYTRSFPEHIEPTRLYTHNADVDRINDERLTAIDTEEKVFQMNTTGRASLVEKLVASCLSPATLRVKVGSVVMCTKNNFEVGYVNGTMGTVIAMDEESGYPIVETYDGLELVITPTTWEVRDEDKVLASMTQVPLRLAWAITVHKSQGMSLDAVEVDLSNCFAYGQGYVALSRARSLAGLRVLGLNEVALQVDPYIQEQDAIFKESSIDIAEAWQELDKEAQKSAIQEFVLRAGGTMSEPKNKSTRAAKQKLGTLELTAELVTVGNTPTEIAAERDLKLITVYGHLEKLNDSGRLPAEYLNKCIKSSGLKATDQKKIQAALDSAEDDKLRPVYDALAEKYTYEQIKLVRMASAVA